MRGKMKPSMKVVCLKQRLPKLLPACTPQFLFCVGWDGMLVLISLKFFTGSDLPCLSVLSRNQKGKYRYCSQFLLSCTAIFLAPPKICPLSGFCLKIFHPMPSTQLVRRACLCILC